MVKRRTNQEWRTLFEQYESSQLSQRLFCERNGLSLSTFFARRQQLKHIKKRTQLGIELSRTTTARWVIRVSEKFAPLFAALKEHLLQQVVVQAD